MTTPFFTVFLCAALFFSTASLNAQDLPPDTPREQSLHAEPSLSDFPSVDSLPPSSVSMPVLSPFDESMLFPPEPTYSGMTRPRVFISTNLVNLIMLSGNLGLEIRWPGNFGLKLSVVGSAKTWPLSADSYKTSVVGFNSEARWYFNRSKTLYFGATFGVLVFTEWERPFDYWTYKSEGPWEKDYRYTAVTAGGLFGYYCRVGRRLAFDFNIGVGAVYMPEVFYFPMPMVSQVGVSLSIDTSRNPPPRRPRGC